MGRRGQLIEFLYEYLRENFGLYFFIILLFILGIVFGALAVKALDGEQKAELFNYLELFIQGFDLTPVNEAGTLLQQSLLGNIKTIGLIWLLGLLVIGLPLVLVILFTKGFALGFTVGFLVYELGWKGLVFGIASVLPPNLFLVPAILLICVAAVSFSLVVIRSRFFTQRHSLYPQLLAYSLWAVITGSLGILASLVEVYISPGFMNLVTRIFL
jgi:stage II sporulation protein M